MNKKIIPQSWQPKVFPEYIVGRAVGYIEEIVFRDKPIAELTSIKAKKIDLEFDLNGCLEISGSSKSRVMPWIIKGDYSRCGFYNSKYPWALELLKYLNTAKIPSKHYHSIAGLLFGYTPENIQEFLERVPR
jgi:hypothetical protein